MCGYYATKMHMLRELTVMKTETKVNVETKIQKLDTKKSENEIFFNTKRQLDSWALALPKTKACDNKALAAKRGKN